MEASIWLGWQANLLLAHLAFPNALVPGYKALGVETHQLMMGMMAHLTPLVFSTSEKCTPNIKITFKRKKRQVIVVGGPLLRGAEGLLWCFSHLCKISCISWVWVEDIIRKLSCLLQPLDCLAVSVPLCHKKP